VLLVVGSTSSEACWAYHQSGALQTFYELHGPGGDDRARVFYVEGDPKTNTSCLFGSSKCNDKTWGNFTKDVAYPIFDDAGLADSLKTQFYPSVYVVCPNKKTYEIKPVNAKGLWENALECPVAGGKNNAGIFQYSAGIPIRELCDTELVKPSFTLINLGSNPLKSATVNLQWKNDVVQTVEWTGNLPVYGEQKILLKAAPLDGAGNLKTTLSNVNSGGDDDQSNNTKVDNFLVAQNFKTKTLVLLLKTDDYGEETYWEIRDHKGNVVETGGNEALGPQGGGVNGEIPEGPGAYADNALIRDTIQIPVAGCYTFHLVDAFGDGICCDFGGGYYKLFDINNLVTPVLSGGEFGAYDNRAFGVQISSGSGEEILPEFDFRLFPNPAADAFNITFRLPQAAALSFRIFNAHGAPVYEQAADPLSAGEHAKTFRTSGLPVGIYLFQALFEGKNVVSKRFAIGQ
jgi:Secretion system C-terminal sorting domain